MLFNDAEVAQLNYLKDVAKFFNLIFNDFNENKLRAIKINGNAVAKDFFFQELKNNIIYIDDLFFDLKSTFLDNVIFRVLNNLVSDFNKNYLEFSNKKIVHNDFLNNIFGLFYVFLNQINDKSLFDGDSKINYETSYDFVNFIELLKKLLYVPGENGEDFIGKLKKKLLFWKIRLIT